MTDKIPMVIVTDRKILDKRLEPSLHQFLTEMERGDYLQQYRSQFIVMRERDLNQRSYKNIFKEVKKVADCHGIPLHSHSHLIEGAVCHLPYSLFSQLKEEEKLPQDFGVSIHHVDEGLEAERAGASYVFFGNVYETSCKPEKVGTGLEKLKDVCSALSIPVYAIGGMDDERGEEAVSCGAKGMAVRSLVSFYLMDI